MTTKTQPITCQCGEHPVWRDYQHQKEGAPPGYIHCFWCNRLVVEEDTGSYPVGDPDAVAVGDPDAVAVEGRVGHCGI